MEIKAGMAGTVWKLLVSMEDEISEEQDLVILESMKMEIPVEAGVTGTVRKVIIQEGDFVNEGDVLMTVDAL